MCFAGDLHNEHKLQVSANLFGEDCRARISRAIKLTPYRFRKCRFERVDYAQFNYTFAKFRRVGEPKVIPFSVQEKLQKEEQQIVESQHGYTVAPDGRALSLPFLAQLKDLIQKHGIRSTMAVQVYGDGFRMFQASKFVNVCFRLLGVEKQQLSGTAFASHTAMVWEGKDTYEHVKQRAGEFLEQVNDLISGKNKLKGVDGKDISIKIIAGGDALWASDINGLSGFANKSCCVYCESEKSKLHDMRHQCRKRTLQRMINAAHMPWQGQFPFTCDCCSTVFNTEQEWAAERVADQSAYALKHRGQRWHWAPLIHIGPENYIICILHALLRVAGAVFKRGIAAHVTDPEIAIQLNIYLHNCLNIYVKKVKVVDLSDAAQILKAPSFKGGEAEVFLEHFEEVLLIACSGVPPTPGSDISAKFQILSKKALALHTRTHIETLAPSEHTRTTRPCVPGPVSLATFLFTRASCRPN